jgi:hypothetical protein
MTEDGMKMIDVRMIETKGQSSLVEYVDEDIPCRAYVPTIEIQDGQCNLYKLQNEYTPYGIPWTQYLSLDITPLGIMKALRERDIWTYEDLQKHDRVLIKIGTDMIGKAVWDAAKRSCVGKIQRR